MLDLDLFTERSVRKQKKITKFLCILQVVKRKSAKTSFEVTFNDVLIFSKEEVVTHNLLFIKEAAKKFF